MKSSFESSGGFRSHALHRFTSSTLQRLLTLSSRLFLLLCSFRYHPLRCRIRSCSLHSFACLLSAPATRIHCMTHSDRNPLHPWLVFACDGSAVYAVASVPPTSVFRSSEKLYLRRTGRSFSFRPSFLQHRSEARLERETKQKSGSSARSKTMNARLYSC